MEQKRILVVDDEQDLCEILQFNLNAAGYQTDVAYSAEEAQEKIGYTDTILDNPDIADETKQQFIQRTNTQAKRLTALLQDISTLNRMDYAPEVLTKERLDVSQIVADIAEETALAFAKIRMTLRNCLPQSIIVHGNASLIYSIFRNLIDNALNYAGEGTTVDISARAMNGHWTFSFSDNGIGISPEHLPRIFERFYRVAKGRSRQMGGTGLGLAIVKNAVLLHGGQITARNAADGGLLFDFSLVNGYPQSPDNGG